jgi:hypothetical protein
MPAGYHGGRKDHTLLAILPAELAPLSLPR